MLVAVLTLRDGGDDRRLQGFLDLVTIAPPSRVPHKIWLLQSFLIVPKVSTACGGCWRIPRSPENDWSGTGKLRMGVLARRSLQPGAGNISDDNKPDLANGSSDCRAVIEGG